MTKYDDWLEQPYHEAALRDNAIEAEIESLLALEYDINKMDVFMDAIANNCMYMAEDEMQIAIKNKDYGRIGELVYQTVEAQVEQWAEDEAARRYNEGLIGNID
jgi:hypothetical protein